MVQYIIIMALATITRIYLDWVKIRITWKTKYRNTIPVQEPISRKKIG
jgi:hypothetical protein